jgi:uncharacterized membrane protein
MVKRRVVNKVDNPNIKKLSIAIIIFSFLAIIISAYLITLHYSDGESFCNLSTEFDCGIVNKSIWSEFPPGSGIPVSLMGALSFGFIILLTELIMHKVEFSIGSTKVNRKLLINIIFYLMLISVLFAAYLLYIELVYILSICILCVALDLLIIIVLILSYKLKGAINE